MEYICANGDDENMEFLSKHRMISLCHSDAKTCAKLPRIGTFVASS